MAVLPEEGRVRVWKMLMEKGLVPDGTVKADIRAVVNAIDDIYDSSAATWNQSLPQPYRGLASAAQKYELFALIGLERSRRLS